MGSSESRAWQGCCPGGCQPWRGLDHSARRTFLTEPGTWETLHRLPPGSPAFQVMWRKLEREWSLANPSPLGCGNHHFPPPWPHQWAYRAQKSLPVSLRISRRRSKTHLLLVWQPGCSTFIFQSQGRWVGTSYSQPQGVGGGSSAVLALSLDPELFIL